MGGCSCFSFFFFVSLLSICQINDNSNDSSSSNSELVQLYNICEHVHVATTLEEISPTSNSEKETYHYNLTDGYYRR